MQILLTVAYDGTRYAGWQRQTNGLAVQQVLEEALSALMARDVIVRAASRTDAGVHALGQRAAFHADGFKVPLEKCPVVLNGYLPHDIAITAAEYVPDDFVPRFRTKQKTYRYTFYNAPYPNPLLRRYSAFVPQTLDIAAMKEAAGYFVGRYDFSAFCAAQGNTRDTETAVVKSNVREIYACEVSQREATSPGAALSWAAPEDALLTLAVTGNGFLYHMVRIIAGTVLYAGLGKIKPGDIPAIIASHDRTRTGKTMPPEGLTLVEVVY